MYLWDSSLETGHKDIDNQHKQLIEALNRITDASQQGKGREEIFKTLDFLTEYTIMHFSAEEKFMADYRYPDYLQHKQIHDAFKVTVGELTQRLQKEGPTGALVSVTTGTIGKWLINHILGDDFKLAVFLVAEEKDGD